MYRAVLLYSSCTAPLRPCPWCRGPTARGTGLVATVRHSVTHHARARMHDPAPSSRVRPPPHDVTALLRLPPWMGPSRGGPRRKDPPGIQRLLDSADGHVTVPRDASAKSAMAVSLFFFYCRQLARVGARSGYCFGLCVLDLAVVCCLLRKQNLIRRLPN